MRSVTTVSNQDGQVSLDLSVSYHPGTKLLKATVGGNTIFEANVEMPKDNLRYHFTQKAVPVIKFQEFGEFKIGHQHLLTHFLQCLPSPDMA